MGQLKFTLDSACGIPYYRQIIQQVEYYVSIGIIKPGYKLPTIRSLAIELKINPNTIAKAYNELEIKGLVVTQVGNGTYISDKKIETSEIELNQKIERIIGSFISSLQSFGLSLNDIKKRINSYEGD